MNTDSAARFPLRFSRGPLRCVFFPTPSAINTLNQRIWYAYRVAEFAFANAKSRLAEV